MPTSKEIIEDIRIKEYGIDFHSSDTDALEIIKKQNRRLHRALEQLSKDLYSKETHFVLELIQNADDNDYTEEKPYLKFILDSGSILVQNNEVGFNEKNVRAICDVGESTKKEKKIRGYIGEKGIGFKSVFRVSDDPSILSNGFSFAFKHRDPKDKLGFVVPHWVNEIPDSFNPMLTNICLPLREEAKEVLSKINDIRPTLILFLRMLKVIEIDDRIKGITSQVERFDKDGIVELHHTREKEFWKLVKSMPLKTPEDIEEEKRRSVEESEITLGFPLDSELTANTSSEQDAFAFLPIKPYGFKFVIQGDFLVTAGRESILEERPWNKWLRDCIADVFIMSVNEFKQIGNLSKTFYNFIPLTNEITDDFFKPVVENIQRRLSETECILTESGTWDKPLNVLRVSKEIRKLIPNDELKAEFSKEYISAEVVADEKILNALGIKRFTIDHLFDFLLKEEWLKKKPEEWLGNLYRFLSQHKLNEEEIEKLRSIRFLRLASERFTSIQDENVFFPLSHGENYGFEGELGILKQATLMLKDKDASQEIRQFLSKIGVQTASPYQVIENHILPLYESDEEENNWTRKGQEKLTSYIRYIRDHLDDYEKESDKKQNAHKEEWQTKEDPLGRLRESLLLRTSRKDSETHYHDHPQNLFLPRIYGNEFNLEKLYEGIEDIFYVNQLYLQDSVQRSGSKGKKKSKKSVKRFRNKEIGLWRKCFLKLGVNEAFQAEKTGDCHLSNSKLEKLRDGARCTYAEIKNYNLKPLKKILKKIQKNKDITTAKSLFSILDSQWEKLSEFEEMEYRWYYRRWQPSINTDATWVYLLKSSEWVPTAGGDLAKPSQIFLDTELTKSLLGDSVPYLGIAHQNEDFRKTLGIHLRPSTKGILNNITALVEKGIKDKETYLRYYTFLDQQFEGNEKKSRPSQFLFRAGC
jgi:hypothetical protein